MSYLGRSAKLSRKTQEKVSFLATAGQTSKTGLSYVPTFVEVSVNGILLTDVTDYTATSGSSITFTVALELNDEVTVVSLKTFALADHYTKTQTDSAVSAAAAALVDSSPAALNTLNELAAALGDDANYATTTTNAIATKLPLAGGTMTGDLDLGDNVKAKFGAGNDLRVYHNGNHSFIEEVGTGNLYIDSASSLNLREYGTSENMAVFTGGGSAAIYHNGSQKLSTTSTGIDVTGTVTADGLVVDTSGSSNASKGLVINTSGTNFESDDGIIQVTHAASGATTGGYFMKMKAGGADKFTVKGDGTVYTAGNVGIGTSNPSFPLHVDGGVYLSGSSNFLRFGANSSAPLGDAIHRPTSGSMAFLTSSAERMRIDSSGNVGIGTSSPTSPLHITGSGHTALTITGGASSDAQIRFGDSDNTTIGMINYDNSANSLKFVVNGSTAARINASGNVGIGVEPEAWDHVTRDALQIGGVSSLAASPNAVAGSELDLQNNAYIAGSGVEKYIVTDKASKYNQFNGKHTFRVAPSGTADSAISWTTAMTINNSGNVGIGTATPETSSFEIRDKSIRISKAASVTAYRILANDHGNDLSIQGSTIADGSSYNTRFNIANNGRVTLGSGTSPTGHLNCVGEYGSGYRAVTFRHTGGGSDVGTIITAASSTSYNTSSDYRLKTDVQPMTGATDRVKLLKPCNFEWISTGERIDGFIAHEAQEVVPEAVTGTKDAMRDEEYEVTPAVLDDEGNETTAAVMGTRSVPDLQGIDQSKLVPLLTATIQELIARIEALENV